MPIYEYRCEQGHTFEVMRRMTDGPVLSCETCSAPVARVFRPIAVHFKGTGFYTTDYGSRKSAREREAGEREAKAEGSKDSKDSKDSKGSKDSKDGSGPSDSTGKDGSKPAKSDSTTSSTAKSSSADSNRRD